MEAKDWATSIITIVSIIVSTYVTRQSFKKSVALSKSDLRIEGLQSALEDYTYQFFVDPKVYGNENSVNMLSKYRLFTKREVEKMMDEDLKQREIDCFLALLISELKYDVVNEYEDPLLYLKIKYPKLSDTEYSLFNESMDRLRQRYNIKRRKKG